MRLRQPSRLQLVLAFFLASLLIVGVRPLVFHAQADKLPNRSVLLNNPLQGQLSKYNFSFNIATAGTLGSIRFQFCSDSPLFDQPCTAPTGFDTAAAILASQSGQTGFAVLSGSPANELVLTRTPSGATTGPVSYIFNNVQNPSAIGSYYVRIQTYASDDGTGINTDYGGLAYTINDVISISTRVPPYLLFCNGLTITGYDCATASGNYINFGELSSTSAKTGSTQMVIATNADSGYGLWIDGTTMQSGNNAIAALTNNDVSRPGTSQFGVNLRANNDPPVGSDPSGPGNGALNTDYALVNRYHFVSGDQLASAGGADDYRKYTVSYLVNIAHDQAAGVYVSTLTYTCLANF